MIGDLNVSRGYPDVLIYVTATHAVSNCHNNSAVAYARRIARIQRFEGFDGSAVLAHRFGNAFRYFAIAADSGRETPPRVALAARKSISITLPGVFLASP